MKNFKFNHLIAVFVIYSMAICSLTAQSNLNFSMKGGPLLATMKFAAGQTKIGGEEPFVQPGGSTMAMAFNVPVYKKFRIGSEIGFNTVENSFYKKIYGKDYNAVYKINQAYLALVPELRILKWLYANAGVGFYSDFNSSIVRGFILDVSQSPAITNVTGETFKRDNSLGYFFGVGVCPNITKDLAVLAEVRFVGSPTGATSNERVNVGYTGGSFSIGLMYKPR
jgi:opacity protein-like surface antigen